MVEWTGNADTDALLAEIDEKAEYIAALETDIADLKATIVKWDDMVQQYERGGFEAVISGLKEQVRVLQNQYFNENREKIEILRSRDYWKKQALKLGWKPEAKGVQQ